MKNQNNNNNSFSFVDETKNIKAKVKVLKRNHQMNIRNTRLRQTLQNDKLLENYFEWNKSAPSGSDLTVYKIITPPPVQHVNFETILPTVSYQVSTDHKRTCNAGVRNPAKKNRVVTSEKIQVKETIKKNLVSDNSCDSAEQHFFSTPNSSTSSNISSDPPLPLTTNSSNHHACYNQFYMQQVIGNCPPTNMPTIDSAQLINSSLSCSSVDGQLLLPFSSPTVPFIVLPSSNISSQTNHLLESLPTMQQSSSLLINLTQASHAVNSDNCWSVEDQQHDDQFNANLHMFSQCDNNLQNGNDNNDDCDSFLSSISYESCRTERDFQLEVIIAANQQQSETNQKIKSDKGF